MKLKKIVTSIVLISMIGLGFSQRSGAGTRSNMDVKLPAILGRVLDQTTGHPIEYANIVLYSAADSVQVTGTITNDRGMFVLSGIQPGDYYLVVDFIGYKSRQVPDVVVKGQNDRVRLGRITLEAAVLEGQSVEVVAERPDISYQIDKKVIDVSKQLTSISGTAVDVLENLPSITVDVEGNVSLRGSQSFQVLIDGVPSILEPAEVLQQIPASSIERIEVITNPSVKFDPDGTSGIVNVILKKSKDTGMNGMFNLNGGLDEKYGGDILLNFQNHQWSYFVSLNGNKSNYPGESRYSNISSFNNIQTVTASSGSRYRNREFYNIRTGMTVKLTPADQIGLSLRYGYRNFSRGSDLIYTQNGDAFPTQEKWLNEGESTRGGDFFSLDLNYNKKFQRPGHKLDGRINYRYRYSEEENSNELRDTLSVLNSGQTIYEEGPSKRLRFQLDYAYPFTTTTKLEAGANGRIGIYEDDTRVEEWDLTQNQYLENPVLTKDVNYERTITALYSQLSSEWKNVKFMPGIRGEYTFRTIEVMQNSEKYSIDRWDFFPSLHISSGMKNGLQLMASYSKRIERPRGWYLEPFETWEDAYNVRKGNPDLQPEYIDSWEAGIQFPWKKNFISLESYYRITKNKIERVHNAYNEEVTLHTFENIGKDYALGIEFMASLDLFKWWNTRLMGNLYDYRIEGQLFNETIDESSFNWDIRFNNAIAFSKKLQLQLNLLYNSPTISSQEERKEFYAVNLALKYDIIPRELIATLQVRDLLSTMEHDFTITGSDFVRKNYFKMDSPIVMLNIRYFINNYKQKRERDRNSENGMDEGEDF